MQFTLSPIAIQKAKEQISKRENTLGIRIGLRGGGCNGLSYIIEFLDKQPTEKDHVFDFDGVKIVIDPKSMIYLHDTILDYETSLMGHGFKFKNPNEKGSCSCGSSVQF